MKVPEIVRQAKQALDEGYAVVIGLQTTGEVRSTIIGWLNIISYTAGKG